MPHLDESGKTAEALAKLTVCYTPLNGTGMKYVPDRLMRMGMLEKNIITVKSQCAPDGNFLTCPAPESGI